VDMGEDEEKVVHGIPFGCRSWRCAREHRRWEARKCMEMMRTLRAGVGAFPSSRNEECRLLGMLRNPCDRLKGRRAQRSGMTRMRDIHWRSDRERASCGDLDGTYTA
jgi:hypothetical protein